MSHATSFKAHIQSPFTSCLTAREGAEGVTAGGEGGEGVKLYASDSVFVLAVFKKNKKNKRHTFPCEKISPQSKAAGDVWDPVKEAGELPTRGLV